MQTTKKGFWDNFTAREDRLIVDGFILTVLGGIALASILFLTLAPTQETQHGYLDTSFWAVAAAPVLIFFLVFILGTWLRRRKTWFPVRGS